jgi:hypothetical protein
MMLESRAFRSVYVSVALSTREAQGARVRGLHEVDALVLMCMFGARARRATEGSSTVW